MDYARNPPPIPGRIRCPSKPFKSYNRSHMQPAPSTRAQDGFMAAMRLEGEKPHQGVPGENPAPNPVREVCKFTVLLGMRGQAELNRVGSCSTGKERDAESGNDYFGARYYSSSMGRWMSPDTDFNLKRILAEPQRWNRYAYVLNNPLILVDPNGLWDIYVFRPEAKGNSAAWNRAAADAKTNGNTMHILNGSAATRGAYLDALKNGDAKVVFVGHSVDDATGKAGSLLLTGNQAVGKLSPYVNPDGTGGTVPSIATPGSIGAESVGAFACTSDTLSGQYSSTDFSGLSGMVFDRTADAGAAAYTDVLARDGSTGDADAAAQKAMDRTQTTINPSDGKPAGPAPKVKEHPDDN